MLNSKCVLKFAWFHEAFWRTIMPRHFCERLWKTVQQQITVKMKINLKISYWVLIADDKETVHHCKHFLLRYNWQISFILSIGYRNLTLPWKYQENYTCNFFKIFSSYLKCLFSLRGIKLKFQLSKIYPNFCVVNDSDAPGSSYSTYVKYRRALRKKLRSCALQSYRTPLAKVNCVALRGFSIAIKIGN